MDASTLAEATTQFTLEEVVQHGQQAGRSPEEIAGAVKKWRDAARSWGEQTLRETDPKKWFSGNAKLDARIRDELVAAQSLAAAERIHRSLPDDVQRTAFATQFQEAGGDPAKMGEPFRPLAEALNREVFESPAFDLPDARDRAMPLTTDAGAILGDFETQARPEGGLDILIRLDDKKEGSRRKAITIPEITEDEIETERLKAEKEARELRAKQEKQDALARGADASASGDIYGAPNPMGAIHRRHAETARLKAEAAESRAQLLAKPVAGRSALLRERVEEEIRNDKDLKKQIGDVNLGEDFWRGVQQTNLGIQMAIADASGNEERKAEIRDAVGMLGQIYPGSTNLQFRGGAGSFMSDTSAVMGGMLPTMIVSTVTGGAGLATKTAVGGLTRAAAIAPISLSAYGNAYATMLNEADSLEQQGKREEAENRRKDARKYAMLQAAVETGSEFIFKEEMFHVGGKTFLGKVAAGAAQNTAEEGIASIGNAELDRQFREQLTPASQIGRDALLGTVVGGLMQVPGGVVEVFLPKRPPMESAPPGLDDPPAASDPEGTPPPSSPPPTEESEPPPSEEGATTEEEPQGPPPGESAVYKVGEQTFTWGGSGWTNQATGEPVDPETEPGLVLQLGEARRQLNAGEQPVSQEVTLNPNEKPTILTIDGQRAFLPAPNGKGWLEVFPGTNQPPRFANFASEGEIGIAILRRLRAKMAEKQAAAIPTPAESTPPAQPAEPAKPEPQPAAEEETSPTVIEPDEPNETTSFDPAKVSIIEFPVAEILLSTDVPNFKEDADPETGVVPGQELGGKFERLGTPPIVLWERLDGRKEIITGRHRLDLARRSGEETIPSQIVREKDGFTREQALVFDAASNIRDGQGTVRDYADFFRNSPALTEAEVESGGLLSRAKGRAGWHLGKSAADDLYALYRAGKITEARAVAIATAAPGNPDAQQIGIRYALEKKDPDFIANVMKASGAESAQRGETIDLFGKDDAAMLEMERRAARAGQFQRAIQDQITAAQSAAKRPEAARKMGIDVSDPAAVQERITELKADVVRWQNWPMHRDLVDLVKGDGPVTAEAASPPKAAPQPARPETEGQLVPESEMPFNLAGEKITEPEPAEPVDNRTDAEKDEDSGQSRLFEDRLEPLRRSSREVQQLVDGFLARHPEKRPQSRPDPQSAAQRHAKLIEDEVSTYFGGDVPPGVRVVSVPAAVWDASFDRARGVIELNAARLRPGEAAFKIEHEIGHLLFQDSEFVAAFEALWYALPQLQRERISRRVNKSIENGYYAEGDRIEETRVRALEAIRRMAAGDHADAAVKSAWKKFVDAVVRAWKRFTGREPVDPQRLAAAMIEIGVSKMREGTEGGEGIALSTIDFEGFKAWALEGVGDDFLLEDAGRLWVAADVDGTITQVFGNFADADAYFRTMSGRGEFLWDVTESYERMVGGIPVRKPDAPITRKDVESRLYLDRPMPGETPAEAGNLPRFTPSGAPVTAAQMPDAALRYGLRTGTEKRRVPDPNRPHRDGARIFSVTEEDDAFRESLVRFQFGTHDTKVHPSFPTASRALKAAGIHAERITLPWSVLREKTSKHDIAIPKVIQLPRFLRDPIIIFDSETQAGAKLVLTELRNHGESLAVAIHLDAKGAVAEIRSIHDRPASQFLRFIENGNAVYYHQEKSRNWLSQVLTRVQFPPSWVQLRQTKSIVSDSDLQGEIYSLGDSIEREQAEAATNLARLEGRFRASYFAGDFDGAGAAMDSASLEVFDAFARKLVRLAKSGNLDAAEMLEWVRHTNEGTRPDLEADAELNALLKAMRERFPERGRGRGLRDHRQQHFSTDSFERAFAQHVANGDFQAAYEAVRDTEDSIRIPILKKWIKEARKGDPVAQKNLEWLSAIFNGTVPPGVKQPPPQSTPKGGAKQTQQQAPPPPPPPPVAPQTPPPRPQGVEKLNIPALVFLARKMGTTPLVRRFAARGGFSPSNPRGEQQANPKIRVNEFLAKEDWNSAARTLAHEIGHFIDYILAAVPAADVVKRIIPFQAIRDQFIEDVFGQGTKYTEAKDYMMKEAIAISKVMRGDFAPTNSYRMSAVELYADFLSAIMIDPEVAFDTAPLLSHAWFAHIEQKPGAESAWNLVQDLIKGDLLHDAIRTDRVAEQRAAMGAVRDRADFRSRLHSGWKKWRNEIAGAIWSRYLPAAAKGATSNGKWEFPARWWQAVTRPKENEFLAKMEGAEIEASQRGSVLRVRMQRDVYDPLLRHGIDTVQLDEYLTFFQILNEDTATRRYLEANPEEFREFLLWLDDAAGLGRDGEITSAQASELDQIGASMVGTIQLHEKMETILAMAQRDDAPEIAARGLFAFDIARYQWNQDGHTPETSQQGMDYLRRELGDERFGVLQDAARAFHRNLEGIVREANDVGLFGDRIWAEKIEPNIGNYVPRMVLDYFTGEMSASIRQRRGSVKSTLPKHLAGEGQAIVLLHKIAKQKQMLFILEQAQDAGWANEISPLTIPRGKDPSVVAKKLRDNEGKGVRGYYANGKWKWLAFDDADVVKWMDTVSSDDLNFMVKIAKANEGFWRLSVTVLNASFALYNNWVRTAVTLPMDYGPKAVAHALRQIPEAVNWARASLGMAPPSDRVLDLVERGVLPAFGQYTAADLLLSDEDLLDQISSGLVGIDALRRGTRVFGPFERIANLPGIHQLIQFLGLFTGTAEALPKLATESLLATRGLPTWERDRLARLEGIPNTGLSAGKYGTYVGLVSLFYRVWVQGTRRLATLPFNPRTRGAWWAGNILGLGAIKMFYSAAASGAVDAIFGALFGGGDDDEKQVDWQEAYTRISPYKIRMTDSFFLGWALPDGSYEPPWGHTAIPSDWRPMMWRLPFTESGRATAPLASLWTWNLWDSPLNLRSTKDAARQVRDVLQNSIFPSLNPVFENSLYALSIFNPRSPYDAYSGRDVVPKDEWDAGIGSRAWGITKHLLEETPAKNLAPAVRNGINNEEDLPLWARAVMSVPGASAALSFDNAQLSADYIERIEKRDGVNRDARLLRGPKAKEAVSLRSRLNRIPAEERTPEEQEKIDLLNEWYRKAYLGSDLYPGLFRELQAAAAGAEGIDVKSAKRELEETAVAVLRAVGGVGR